MCAAWESLTDSRPILIFYRVLTCSEQIARCLQCAKTKINTSLETVEYQKRQCEMGSTYVCIILPIGVRRQPLVW